MKGSLLKSMKKKHLDDAMKKGRFCFNHPTVFSEWKDKEAAQHDRWEAHDAYEATHLIAAPIIGENNGIPIYGKPHKIADRAIIHMQSESAKHTPICCFRCIMQSEIVVDGKSIVYSLGDTANRIVNEFGHDAFLIIPIRPFLERLSQKVDRFLAMDVAYHDLLNNHHFDVDEQYREIVEQLFRKDEKYEWQKEYRIILPPTQQAPVFIEIGSIEDIAVCGNIKDLID